MSINKERVKRIVNSNGVMYGIIIVATTIIFCYIYGVYVLDPTYTDWLIKGSHGDMGQHYLGWKAYRASKWTFPIGCTSYLAYPSKTSIIFTDSIPCFAVFFKLLSPIFPKEFQYFGLWGLSCFVLQGVLTARIISRFTNNKIFIIFVSVLLSLTPSVIRKMYGHTALAGQWIILLALDPVIGHKAYANGKKKYAVWGIIGVLAASIHIYFVLICGIILFGDCVADIVKSKQVKQAIAKLGIYLLSTVTVVGMLGGFSLGSSMASAGGLGEQSFNLNALFNPQGYSCIFQDLPLYIVSQYEGFTYLGAGIILLTVFVVSKITNIKMKCVISNYSHEFLALLIMCSAALLFALSPIITIGDKVLLEVSLPEVIIKYWSIFRACGRAAWIIMYVIILCTCIMCCKVNGKRAAAIIISFCVLVQAYDLHIQLYDRHVKYNQKVEYNTVFTDFSDDIAAFWKQIKDVGGMKHIVFTQPTTGANLYAFADWALSNDITLNQFYFARDLWGEEAKCNLQEALSHPTRQEVFIFFEANKDQCAKYDLNYYFIDEYIVGYAGVLDGWESYSKDYFSSY